MKCGMTFWSCHAIDNVSSMLSNCIINGNIAFDLSSWSKWAATWHFGHLIPLPPVSASHDPHSIGNGTITFLRSRQSIWGATSLFGNVIHLALVLTSHTTNCIINDITSFCEVKKIEMRCNRTFWIMWHHWHQIMLMVLSMALLNVASRWLKSCKTWLCWSCDTICNSITWCWQHGQWHYCIC